ncbi:MAG TPA: hypothetical protein VML75_12250, partial [Kofleriaceae bacterium]|nr:hypothetical protein [Kofleriaceae bacterium]
SKVQGTLVHQVPGGPSATSPTQYSDISVAAPTLELVSLHSLPRMESRMTVGETFMARIEVGNVDGEQMPEFMGARSQSGPGYDCLNGGSTTFVSGDANGKTYDIEYTAVKVGSVAMNVELGIGDMALGSGPKVTIEMDVEHDRQQFLNLCSQCDTKIARAYTRADTIMEKLSAAYGDAYEGHLAGLRAQSASNRLAADIILGAALAFIPGGVGGVVGSWMKSAEVGDFLADAIKDMAKAGAKGVQGALGSEGGSALTPMGPNPRTWRASYVARVNAEKELVLDILDDWKTKANASDPEFYMNFDPVAETEAGLTRDGNPLKDIAVPDQDEHAKQFELGMWRSWLESFAYTVVAMPTYTGQRHIVEENQGKKIRDRINALGENGDEWLERYGGVAKRNAEREAAERNRSRY